jgi:hypothetical protein
VEKVTTEEMKQVVSEEPERLHGIISMNSVGEVVCDKCGKIIRHQDKYCVNTRECYHCLTVFNLVAELNNHFVESHSPETPRGTRYCEECSIKAGYLGTVRNKKTGEVFPAMLVLRDEEPVDISEED